MTLTVGWKMRFGLVLSAIWLCLAFLVADDYRWGGQFLAIGIFPLVVIWGIAWAISGWRAQRPPTPRVDESVLIEKRARRSARIRTAVVVIAALVGGVYAAAWQLKSGNIDSGDLIASWFGQWFTYGLVAYLVLRALKKLPYGFPAFVSALIIVGGINWKAYELVVERRLFVGSLTLAVPILTKLQTGTPITDKEVLDARVGFLEPLLLAEAESGREATAIAAKYQQAIADLAPEQLLAPESLVSSNGRFQTRLKLKLFQQAAAQYKAEMSAAIPRTRLRLKAALVKLPDSYASTVTNAFDTKMAQLAAYVDEQVKLVDELIHATTGILDLLDANPGSYVLDKGPPPNLLFRDERTLRQYRGYLNAILEIAKREQASASRLGQIQARSAESLADALRR